MTTIADLRKADNEMAVTVTDTTAMALFAGYMEQTNTMAHRYGDGSVYPNILEMGGGIDAMMLRCRMTSRVIDIRCRPLLECEMCDAWLMDVVAELGREAAHEMATDGGVLWCTFSSRAALKTRDFLEKWQARKEREADERIKAEGHPAMQKLINKWKTEQVQPA